MTRQEELEKYARRLQLRHGQRRGQTLMNALHTIDKDAYQAIAGSTSDCYYLDAMIPAFYAKLNTIWITYS